MSILLTFIVFNYTNNVQKCQWKQQNKYGIIKTQRKRGNKKYNVFKISGTIITNKNSGFTEKAVAII